MQGSANLNLMIKAARKAGRSLVKDFREVENLQVGVKGPGDFVSKADREAERIIRDELMGARPEAAGVPASPRVKRCAWRPGRWRPPQRKADLPRSCGYPHDRSGAVGSGFSVTSVR